MSSDGTRSLFRVRLRYDVSIPPLATGNSNVMLADQRTLERHILLQPADGSAKLDGVVTGAMLSADGRIALVASQAGNVVSPPLPAGGQHLYRVDVDAGETTSLGHLGLGASDHVRWLAPDGSSALVASQLGPQSFALSFIDLATGARTYPIGSAVAASPEVVSDSAGSRIVFSSTEPLVVGDTNDAADVFVWSRESGQVTRSSLTGSGAQGPSTGPGGITVRYTPQSITDDGRFVLFASNVALNDGDAQYSVYVRDRQALTTEALGAPSHGGTTFASVAVMSADGSKLLQNVWNNDSALYTDLDSGTSVQVCANGELVDDGLSLLCEHGWWHAPEYTKPAGDRPRTPVCSEADSYGPSCVVGGGSLANAAFTLLADTTSSGQSRWFEISVAANDLHFSDGIRWQSAPTTATTAVVPAGLFLEGQRVRWRVVTTGFGGEVRRSGSVPIQIGERHTSYSVATSDSIRVGYLPGGTPLALWSPSGDFEGVDPRSTRVLWRAEERRSFRCFHRRPRQPDWLAGLSVRAATTQLRRGAS
jgi:hypothetical protein